MKTTAKGRATWGRFIAKEVWGADDEFFLALIADVDDATRLLQELLRNFKPEHLDKVAGADFGRRCWDFLKEPT